MAAFVIVKQRYMVACGLHQFIESKHMWWGIVPAEKAKRVVRMLRFFYFKTHTVALARLLKNNLKNRRKRGKKEIDWQWWRLPRKENKCLAMCRIEKDSCIVFIYFQRILVKYAHTDREPIVFTIGRKPWIWFAVVWGEIKRVERWKLYLLRIFASESTH